MAVSFLFYYRRFDEYVERAFYLVALLFPEEPLYDGYPRKKRYAARGAFETVAVEPSEQNHLLVLNLHDGFETAHGGSGRRIFFGAVRELRLLELYLQRYVPVARHVWRDLDRKVGIDGFPRVRLGL